MKIFQWWPLPHLAVTSLQHVQLRQDNDTTSSVHVSCGMCRCVMCHVHHDCRRHILSHAILNDISQCDAISNFLDNNFIYCGVRVAQKLGVWNGNVIKAGLFDFKHVNYTVHIKGISLSKVGPAWRRETTHHHVCTVP